ncbi:MAG: hypothetical protein ACSLFQ_15685 [Thermoanaerobaculia bacterium]
MARASVAIAALLALLLAGGCASGARAHPPRLADGAEPRGVVVFVPGITGSQLHDRESGRIVWGDLRSFFLPRDDGYALALPIGDAEDRLEAGAPMLRVGTLPLMRRDVYLPIVLAFEDAGYRRGDDLVLFGYDFRRDSVDNGRLLARRIDEISASPDGSAREVHLVCQSNATYLCRWAVRFGDVSMDDAERGIRRQPSRARIASVTLLATANGGGIRILREIDRGRIYMKFFGRRFRPEAFFTYVSLYQDLPSGRDDLFIDLEGRPLDIDLFDARSWKTYGWSIFGREAARRAARAPEIFADEPKRLTLLQRWLDDARRLHALLISDAAPWPEATRLVSIQGKSLPTMNRAVVMRDGSGWKTLFIGDAELEGRPELGRLLSEPGDIHASLTSQQRLAPSELRALGSATHYVEGDHLTVAHGEEALSVMVEGAK